MKTIPDASFDFVRYANCWEDADILVNALRPAPGKRFLSIASAGDNSLSLLADGADVVAVDVNPAQLASAELRRAAIRQLAQPEFLEFAGIRPSAFRKQTYAAIAGVLSPVARSYWDARGAIIAGGFVHAGKFENYFRLFRRRLLPLVHTRGRVAELLREKSRGERIVFYEKEWNTWRWRLLFRLFFSQFVMGRLGRDPEFFRHVEGRVSTRILDRTRYALTELDTGGNPYLTYILTGNFGSALPHYLRPENYERIRRNIAGLTIKAGAVDAVVAEEGAACFDGFNLSDIFEYLSAAQCEAVYGRLLASARPGARFVYWNMLVPRQCPEPLSGRVRPLTAEAERLFRQDKAFFYSRFVVEEVVT